MKTISSLIRIKYLSLTLPLSALLVLFVELVLTPVVEGDLILKEKQRGNTFRLMVRDYLSREDIWTVRKMSKIFVDEKQTSKIVIKSDEDIIVSIPMHTNSSLTKVMSIRHDTWIIETYVNSKELFSQLLRLKAIVYSMFLVAIMITLLISSRVTSMVKKELIEVVDLLSGNKDYHSSKGLSLEAYHSHKKIKSVLDKSIEISSYKERKNIVSEVAHDLRSPMAIIEDVARLLPDGQYSKLIMTAVNRAKLICEDILSEKKLEVKLYSTSQILFEIKKLRFKRKVSITCLNIDDRTRVSINLISLLRVLNNIIMNAVEANSEDVNIKVEIANKTLNIYIIDNGDGMDSLTINKALEGEYTSKNNGNGIGLSSSKKKLEAMESSLKIESKLGVGTTMVIGIPIV